MIKFNKEDRKVKVVISPGIDNQVMMLDFNTNDEWYASLLAKHLQDALWHKLRSIREEAYKNGWNDKASHKKKRETCFTGFW